MPVAFSLVRDHDGAEITVGGFHAHVEARHFRVPETTEEERRLFARSVQHVVLELSAYCNRRCGFCPNTIGTRLNGERLMPQGTFERIISDLAVIDYAQTIYFHLYNEPLAAPEILLPRMKYARGRLPKAILSFNTNGDYLTSALLANLEAAGCNGICVSIYGPDHGRWDEDYIRQRVQRVAKMLGLEGTPIERPGIEHAISGSVGAVKLRIAGRNLWNTGYDRGGLIPELRVNRSSPCLAPFTEFLVDHRGYALPCCNVYTDRVEHLQHTLGNMNAAEIDIFTIYAGARARAWRKGLLRFHPVGDLCGGCSRGNYPALDTAENKASLVRLREQMSFADLATEIA